VGIVGTPTAGRFVRESVGVVGSTHTNHKRVLRFAAHRAHM
jgi:hypothetical protein